MNNHVIDPIFFWDAIEEFSFDYTIYIETNKDAIDDYGRRIYTYTTETIRGSLQSLGENIKQSKTGNTYVKEYNFYCKSIYRINIGDVIFYKNNYLRCDRLMDDYDEYGVRGAHLTMIKLTSYRDLAEYVKYQQGREII